MPARVIALTSQTCPTAVDEHAARDSTAFCALAAGNGRRGAYTWLAAGRLTELGSRDGKPGVRDADTRWTALLTRRGQLRCTGDAQGDPPTHRRLSASCAFRGFQGSDPGVGWLVRPALVDPWTDALSGAGRHDAGARRHIPLPCEADTGFLPGWRLHSRGPVDPAPRQAHGRATGEVDRDRSDARPSVARPIGQWSWPSRKPRRDAGSSLRDSSRSFRRRSSS